MAKHTKSKPDIPVLTEVVATENETEPVEPLAATGEPTDVEALIAELQTTLAARTFALTDELLRSAFSEMEATLFEQVSNKLRQELPELIDSVLRQHLDAEDDG